MDIENGGYWEQPLARNLSPEPRGLETIGKGHHNGPKLVFNILLERGKMERIQEQFSGPSYPMKNSETWKEV